MALRACVFIWPNPMRTNYIPTEARDFSLAQAQRFVAMIATRHLPKLSSWPAYEFQSSLIKLSTLS